MISAIQANSIHAVESSEPLHIKMQNKFMVLVISPDLEGRRTVCRILEALSVDIITCSMFNQAQQILSLQRPNLIFCEEQLPDGSYADILELKFSTKTPPLVVLTRTGEWELYMHATRRGAFDVIRSPWCPTDIEMSLIRAVREENYHISALVR